MLDKHQVTEEPCEVKVSSTVLKTNGVGDSLVEFNQKLEIIFRLNLDKLEVFLQLEKRSRGFCNLLDKAFEINE